MQSEKIHFILVPSLPHPATYISSDFPSRLSDLVVSDSSESDFQIFSPFSGMKTLELTLHWNPTKNLTILKLDEIVDVSDTPYDNLSEIVQEYICFDSDNLLELIDFKTTKEIDEIYLRTKKEKKRLKQLEEKESAIFTTPRVTSTSVVSSKKSNNCSLASYF